MIREWMLSANEWMLPGWETAELLAVPVLWLVYRRDLSRGIRPPDRSWTAGLKVYAAAIGGFLLYYALVTLLLNACGLAEADAAYREAAGREMLHPARFFFRTVFTAPLFEELLFRGVLQRRLEKHAGNVFAVVLSAVLFGLYHGTPVQGLAAFLAGLFLGYVYFRTDALLVSILMHAASNAAGFAAVLSILYSGGGIK